jgi:hypothetical protein
MLEGWLHAVASVNPIGHLMTAARSLLAGQPEEIGLALGSLAIVFGLLTVWALGGVRSAERAGG